MTSQPSRHLAALARAATILRRLEAGENKSAIARELGVTRQRVQAIARYGRLMRDMAVSHHDPECVICGQAIPAGEPSYLGECAKCSNAADDAFNAPQRED